MTDAELTPMTCPPGTDRWPEYDAGLLTAPAIVQHDLVGDEHLVWVWDGMGILGPLSRAVYDEAEILAVASALAADARQVMTPEVG